MIPSRRTSAFIAALALVTASALSACSTMGMPSMSPSSVKLAGDQEVPAVLTTASGTSTIAVAGDGTVTGSITTTGIVGTMAHIHVGAVGKNGPVIVPLASTSEGVWSVPAGTKLTAEQLASYQAGELYVNVHSAANKGGEIRAQLKP